MKASDWYFFLWFVIPLIIGIYDFFKFHIGDFFVVFRNGWFWVIESIIGLVVYFIVKLYFDNIRSKYIQNEIKLNTQLRNIGAEQNDIIKSNQIEIDFLKQKVFSLDEQKTINGLNQAKIKTNELEIDSLKQKIHSLEECINKKDLFYEEIVVNGLNISKLTSFIADFKLLQYQISAEYLESKKNPAIKEALRIRELHAQTKIYIQQLKETEYKFENLLALYPELEKYVDDYGLVGLPEEVVNDYESEYDIVYDFLSKEEYLNLNENERNQLALNNYKKGKKKTKWQIGRDYEMYVAHTYRLKGYKVINFGVTQKLEDMGRDLIVIVNNKNHLIVQCKFWSEKKLIHEKHIAQLFGTTHEYMVKNNVKANPVFVTNIDLSDTAVQFAKNLNVEILKMSLGDYPMIKCNINNNQKIYHLPFDQKYDFVKLENKGEAYVNTVKEAVDLGFRRAFRYSGLKKK